MTAAVPGVGTVLVNGSGRTFYVLSSEKGARRFTCTDANHCTDVWPDTGGLPAGMMHGIAGPGVNASSLGTYTSSSGDHYLTYGGWPLYTYTGDTGPGTAKGEGITSFGGTWWTINAAGNPVTS
jgi:predicted lipoprotein with Yx(FWY)xxD motif